MVDDKGLLKRDLAEDGLHPNAAGYKIMAPLADAAIGKALGQTLMSLIGSPRRIYNVVEFPTAPAFGYTLAVAARDVLSLRSLLAVLRLKALIAKVDKDSAKFAKKTNPRVQVETPVPPGFARSHWKGNSRRDFPACLSLPAQSRSMVVNRSADSYACQPVTERRTTKRLNAECHAA